MSDDSINDGKKSLRLFVWTFTASFEMMLFLFVMFHLVHSFMHMPASIHSKSDLNLFNIAEKAYKHQIHMIYASNLSPPNEIFTYWIKFRYMYAWHNNVVNVHRLKIFAFNHCLLIRSKATIESRLFSLIIHWIRSLPILCDFTEWQKPIEWFVKRDNYFFFGNEETFIFMNKIGEKFIPFNHDFHVQYTLIGWEKSHLFNHRQMNFFRSDETFWTAVSNSTQYFLLEFTLYALSRGMNDAR